MLQPIKQSTTSLGKAYERHCHLFLSSQLDMDLRQVGGKGDRGVDLRGWWRVPRFRSRSLDHESKEEAAMDMRKIRVLVQCKAEKSKAGPRIIRELEGTWRQSTSESQTFTNSFSSSASSSSSLSSSANSDTPQNLSPNSRNPQSTIAILCAASGFSPSAARDLTSSSIPMLLLHLPLSTMTTDVLDDGPFSESEIDDEELDLGNSHGERKGHGRLFQGALWNSALVGPQGILGSEMELRRVYSTASEDEGRRQDHGSFGLQLFYEGRDTRDLR